MDDHLTLAGLHRTGEPEQIRLRPWGTVFKIPTAHGPVWFKAPAPATVFEVGLYGLLASAAPNLVLDPIPIDRNRGWLLLPNGGPTLGELASGPALIDTLRRIAAHRDTYVGWYDALAIVPAVPSINHHDLHAKNIFVTAPGPPLQLAFADWGDAVIAHPFASLLVALGFVRFQLKVNATDPAVLRVRDAYLGAFTDLASHCDLVATADLACQVAKVTRALVWLRSLEAANDPAHPFAREPLACLATILNDDPLDTSDP